MHHLHSKGHDHCGGHAHARHGDFGRHGFKHPFMGGMPHGFGPGRARRGDIRAAVLRLLSEAPMHGYQMIQELAERSGGAWSPSAGSVYPTLQQLADEGLIVAEETSGKKVFSLTDAGTAEVAKTAGQPAPWEEASVSDSGVSDYREAVGKFIGAAFQIGKGGTKEQREAALAVINDARKALYKILAED